MELILKNSKIVENNTLMNDISMENIKFDNKINMNYLSKLKLQYPKNINKYNGNIYEEEDCYILEIKLPDNTLMTEKMYFTKKNKRKVLNSIKNLKKEITKKHYTILNTYYKISNYYLINLPENYKILVDKCDYFIIDSLKWHIHKNNKLPYVIINSVSLLDKLCIKLKKTNPNYKKLYVKINKYVFFPFLKYGLFFMEISFKNKNSYDYRSCNIIPNTYNKHVSYEEISRIQKPLYKLYKKENMVICI